MTYQNYPNGAIMSTILTKLFNMPTREDELNRALESMYFGFRAMTFQPDQRLAQLGLTRVHHRVLYFIARQPGCSVNELLQRMRVSKQYLHQPLRKLIALGYVTQQPDRKDRRVKRLRLSTRGKKLESELTGTQRARFAEIFDEVGPGAERQWRQVMALLGDRFEF